MTAAADTPGAIPAHTFGTSRFVATPDDRRLHTMSRGTGPVTVVFESGMGLSRNIWGLVVPDVAEQARTVVYDRACSGRSGDDAEPRTLARTARDLGVLLDELGDGPLVLVGHSSGGLIVRAAAARYSERVCAIVLVDPSDENFPLYFTRSTRLLALLYRVIAPVARRIRRRRPPTVPLGGPQPADVLADIRAEELMTRAVQSGDAELRRFLADIAALRRSPPHLGDTPVTVISAASPSPRGRKVREGLTAAHRVSVAALADSRHVEARNSEHMIMYTEPLIIVDEIVRAVGRAASPR